MGEARGKDRQPGPAGWLVRPLWGLLGLVALGIGGLGVLLPVLPTTPFVLLAAFCFSRGAPRLGAWIERSRTFGPILADWRETGAITPRIKAVAVGMMAVVLVASLLGGATLWVLGLQAVLIALGAAYVLSRPNGR